MRAIAVSLRRLRQSPVFTLFSIVTLALGIGVTTAAYSGIRVLFATTSGIADTGSVVFLTHTSGIVRDVPAGVSWADYRDLTAGTTPFAGLAAAAGPIQGALATRDATELVQLEAVTGNYFSLLGVPASIGRPIQPADDRPDAPLVIVITDTTWRSQFRGDPAVVGTTVRMAGQTLEVVGVAPDGFRGARGLGVSRLGGWVPLTTASRLEPLLALDLQRRRGSLMVVGRLAPSSTLEEAGVAVTTLGARLDRSVPLPPTRQRPDSAPVPSTRAWGVATHGTVMARFNFGEASRLIMVLPALVLLVACTNLANLILSRGVSRRHEFAVRAALGASRGRLIREELVEATALAFVGGALGLLVTQGLLSWTLVVLREPLSALAPEVILNWRFHPGVLAAAGAAVLLTLLVAGLIPALQLTRPNPGRALAADAGGALPRWRGRSNLIALQVCVSVALFLISIVCIRFIVQPPAERFAGGIDLTDLAIANVPFERQQYDEPRARQAIDAVFAELRRSPRIETVAAGTRFPIRIVGLPGRSSSRYVAPAGQACPGAQARGDGPWADRLGVSPGFLEALNMPPLLGRSFDDRDRNGAERVVLLSQALARRVFGQENVVGRGVTLCPDPQGWAVNATGPIESATIVGIVGDGELTTRGTPTFRVYAPLAQYYEPIVTFVARGRQIDPRATVGMLASAIRRADSELAVAVAGRADVMARGPLAFLGFIATVTGGMATLALVLAMAGLYGVLSHVVEKRRREMGVRIALGATYSRLVRLVLRDGLRPVVEGTCIGLGVAAVVRQILQLGFTEPLSSIDLAMFLLAAVPLLAAGFVSAYLPARRAARVNPNVALKDL